AGSGGIDAVNRGEFLAVLGELHAGMNSLLVPAVPNAQGDPDAPFALRDLDLERPCVAPVWSRRRSRLDYYSRSPRDFDLELAAARSSRPRSQVLALADLVVEEVGGALCVRTRDGRMRFDAIAFLEHHLLANSFSEFGLLGGRHAPRVVVDGVVLVRERWIAAAAALAFARADDATQRFAQARAWARSAGLPRRLFLKVPHETKPLFLDLASPTFVELAARMVRKAQTVSISEMLPDLDELWLVDAGHRRYTSELRLVAVDPEPWLPE
ncbi:MAG TPA: lantibiotic dehydratase, partial [Kofleriaceae bacterium]